MTIRQWVALILISPVALIFWIVTAFEILFYPYTAIVVGLIANGRWITFHEYLNDVVGEPFGG
ncbi:hypothetical protein K3F51_05110 [Limosilactobacillus reuteri]|uniref:hypothetical protein n=1 Tax=Limosilactobacillus reuteri TaxID=1598 RepID=UPI001CBABABE|nr:hypothetical protein [Limosilactobacillus reuteri]UAW61292.1 hypothetical protein K3F51_05110 [Limosilactobacillus reuteri]